MSNIEESVGRFHAGICALLWCSTTSRYLLLRRASHRDVGAGEWECVTGRVNQGEGYSEAVYRESQEELGIDVRLDFIVGTTHFYRGESIVENEMVGVIYCCSTAGESVELSAEHSECRWIRAEEANGLLPEGHWLPAIIQRAEAVRALLPAELLDYHHANGFEL
jgi:8-oxo-dGTP diphosphatase